VSQFERPLSTRLPTFGLIVWCNACQHQAEPDPAEMVERHGAETTVLDWCDRLVCAKCGSRETDMVVTGTKRRAE
jgi:hypothetical protein